jgi:hypothetical protein
MGRNIGFKLTCPYGNIFRKDLRVMNPRRVHELMKVNFPKVDLAKSTWVNLLERDGTLRGDALVKLMDEFIVADDVLVEVSRKPGDLVQRQDLVSYVGTNAGQGEIR